MRGAQHACHQYRNPATGETQPIGLGWLDDAMQLVGPTEEDKNYIADTCGDAASPKCAQELQSQVEAYEANKLALIKKVIPLGGFWWQLLGSNHPVTPNTGCDAKDPKHCSPPVPPTQCAKMLRAQCPPKGSGTTPASWNKMQLYKIEKNGDNFGNVTPAMFVDYTAEFLLTRGPYAMLGYSWCGCTNGNESRPYPEAWDADYGEPVGGEPCYETAEGSAVFERAWTRAKVQWDCAAGHGKIIESRQ